jgi:hypothetical protein
LLIFCITGFKRCSAKNNRQAQKEVGEGGGNEGEELEIETRPV